MEDIKELSTTDEAANQTSSRYHVVHHGDNGVEAHSFRTKRELTRHLRPHRPDSIIAMFRGSNLHATITNEYQII